LRFWIHRALRGFLRVKPYVIAAAESLSLS
jgi:hypothetical protein